MTNAKKKPRVLVMYLDPDELPRAYAYGPKDHEAEIETRALEELTSYCRKKQVLGDLRLANPSNFSRRRVVLK